MSDENWFDDVIERVDKNCERIQEAIELIDGHLSKIENLWFPIGDRAPPKNETILFLVEALTQDGWSQIIIEGVNSEEEGSVIYHAVIEDFDEYKITHWMPRVLPKPSWEE